jgi:hypothetical protein
VPEYGGVRTAQQRQVAQNQQNANLRRTEYALRQLEAGQGIGSQVALTRQEQKRDQHRDRSLPVHEAGKAEAAHQRDAYEDVHHVIDIEAIARTLLVAYAGLRPVHAVSKPVENQA